MPSLLDEQPFPFDQPAGRQLHIALCELYPNSKAAVFMASKVGIEEYELSTGDPAYFIWRDILKEAANREITHTLVELVLEDRPRTPRREFFQSLLADSPTPPLNHDDTEFRKKPEALLYHDDLTLLIDELPELIDALGKMRTLAPSVCKLEVTCPGWRGVGTGFRVSPDLLLTNEHVLYLEGNSPTQVLATFGYEGTSAGIPVNCEVAEIKKDKNDDWAVIRMEAPPAIAVYPPVPFAGSAEPVKGTGAFLIQHPAGDRKRIAYARNRIADFDAQLVHYASDTQTGSSGAPVFDVQGRLIALHRAGGEPQEAAGQIPMRMNEGVRIDRVRQGLANVGINL
jgi:hypothetical protein